jgi:hypothetical protein
MQRHRVLLAPAFVALMLAAPTSAQSVTVEELVGASIQGSAGFNMRVRNPRGEFPSHMTWSFRMAIGPAGKIDGSATRTVTTPKGPQSKTQKMGGTIGVPGAGSDGEGNRLWLLDGDKLTLLRTFGTGGFKAEVTLNGSSCTVRAVMVREEGAGATRRSEGVVGGPVTVLSMTPTGSTSCRITLPAKKPGAGDEKKPAT